MSRSLVVNLLGLALALVAATTLVALVALWPDGGSLERPDALRRTETQGAKVVGLRSVSCPAPGQRGCVSVTAEIDGGEHADFTVADPAAARELSVGDAIRVFENPLPEGAEIGGVPIARYGLADFERRVPLLWLALAFAVLVVATSRWQGLRALAGLAISLVLVVKFVVPAILAGSSPSGIALVGALAIMLVTIPLAHGFGPKAAAACLGTTVSLLVVLGLGTLFVELAHLTGLSSEEAVYLRTVAGDISVHGLLLAGMVIGALGVLDDLTVTQASTVAALRRANSSYGFRELFRSAVAVGHDHIAATVNTLVLAYVGASLPILLVFSLGDVGVGDAVNSEAVATEIVATLAGSIGLILAVPVTTALASLLVLRLDPARLDDPHAHGH